MNDNIENYLIAMNTANYMMSKGIITTNDLTKIDTIMSKKYQISSFSLFRYNPLISTQNSGNINIYGG